MLTRKWVAPATYVHTAGSSPEHDPQVATTAPDEGLESSTVVRGGLAFAYGVGQTWLPGGYFVPSAQPQDFAFEFWRGAGQFTAGVVEVVVGAALVGGGGTAAGGGVAASLATGGASLLVTAAGGSAATAGWAAVGHGATGIVAGLATLADSLSLSTGAASGSGGTGPQGTTPAPGGRQNVTDILRPGGKLIGNPGTSPKIRLLQGGRPEAEALFARLTQGGEAITSTNYPGQLVRLPDGGRIGFRPTSTMWATDNRRIC
jgi:hypothetical protein